MTPFTPKTVWTWYKRRHIVWKVLLALVLIIPIVLAAIWWFMGRVTQPTEQDITEIREKHEDERRKEAEARDKLYAEEIAALEKAREDKEKDKQAIMEGNKESHENIDKVDGISAHIDAYNRDRRHRKP